MKGMIFLFMLTYLTAGQAQVIQLAETKINYSPRAVVHSSSPGHLVMSISQEYSTQFTTDPIKFMKENFEIQPFISSQKRKFDTYIVDFRTSKGRLEAQFDGKGQLVKTIQSFKNGYMPLALKRNIFLENKGWSIANYHYYALGQKDRIVNEIYRVKLVNGSESKTIKIRPERYSKIASN